MATTFETYFTISGESVLFTGDKLIIRIPVRYETYDLLSYGNTIRTLGIFDMIFDDTIQHGLLFPSVIEMEPTSVYKERDDEVDFIVGEFYKNDVFIVNKHVLKQPNIAYATFVEFMKNGNIPKFLSYDQLAVLFDNISRNCDFNPRINHAVFEMMFAHLSRDPNQMNIKYRYTDMKVPPAFIGLRNVAYGTDSTTTRIIGSYLHDGVNAALLNKSTENHDMEDLLRY